MRMIGDSIFALGAVVLGWFVLGLVTGHSYDKQGYSWKEDGKHYCKKSLRCSDNRPRFTISFIGLSL
jgi:hypothetical protein